METNHPGNTQQHRNTLINYKGLSVSVVEWVDAIERREHEILEKEAYEETQNNA